MRMAFNKFKEFPGNALKFIADGYSAYSLVCQQFAIQEKKFFNVTQVIGLTNDDAISTNFSSLQTENGTNVLYSSYYLPIHYLYTNGEKHAIMMRNIHACPSAD